MKRLLFIGGLSLLAATAGAQSYQEGYVEWGSFGQQFGTTLKNWEPGQQITEDDNFFISRVKPKNRFRNAATQVRTNIDESNDKKLLMWVPIDDAEENSLPNGVYDSEVFNMWQYISHYGNWTAPQGRVPGNFADVAHKNGVAVSSVAGIPYGGLYGNGWQEAMQAVVDAGAEKGAKFLHYYGLDGLGYNSEFSGGAYIVRQLITYHQELLEKSLPLNPLFENLWYDGTNDNGYISFDQGLGDHNNDIAKGASLFFNYNWNRSTLLQSSVDYAKNNGYNPLNIYAGVNMQGAEPGSNSWPLLRNYPISIGLWGAHSRNMFWESRGEKGSAPEVKQRTYLLRTERWFTGGTRNPANCPEVTSSMKYHADNVTFHGMSSFMTAKSTLSWDLETEPFITYFNLGNGKFFNWNGVRQHNGEWYNIGVQDYLPTWRWWFTTKLLGHDAADVAANGLDAEFTWDDAWVGGSTVRVFGSTEGEYLHLFKTQYDIADGDVITFRYKLAAGSADIDLVLTAVGSESESLGNLKVCAADQDADEDVWVERTFTVGKDIKAEEIALVALHFNNAKEMNLYLGEFSIVRNAAAAPAKPVIASSKALAFSKYGVDAKIVFNMPNDKAAGEPCYNIDVNTALFKIYAQQEGCEPVLMGLTTSWAGLVYNIPMSLENADKVRLGVAAVSLDMKSDSEIAWSEYMDAGTYVYDDEIQINKNTIKPLEDFEISFVDPRHEDADWTITDSNGNVLYTATGAKKITVAEGPASTGNYTLTVTGPVYDADGNRTSVKREFANYIQITGKGVGALPKILTLTANGKEADITVNAGDAVALAYTGREANGAGSQGLNLNEERFGAKCADLGLVGAKTFSTAFWLKINKLAAGETQLLAVANKVDSWPKTDWGWIWANIKDDGTMGSFTFRGTDATNNNELRYKFENATVPVGSWVHFAFAFEYDASGAFRADFYINGVKQELTRWNRSTNGDTYFDTDPGYQRNVYNITNGQVISVGGAAHGRNGIDGVIDNFQIWDKMMTAEDVAVSMSDIDPNSLPAGLAAYWDFENEAGADFTFKSVGPKANVAAGMHNYAATGSEGQGAFSWIEAVYTSGCPFISGTAFPVVTVPTWKTKKGVVEAGEGSDVTGTATVKYENGGEYAVTLTLTNSLGSDQRTFQVIKVDAAEGIEDVTAAEMKAYAVDGAAIVEFAQEGDYTVGVYTAAGQKVAGKAVTIAAGETVQVALGAKGTYVLVVEKDGKVVRSVKLLNK